MLELRDISFCYDRPVVSGVSLEVKAGEIVALLGPNGAGKSTLLAIACGALKQQMGDVLFDERPLADFSRREIARTIALVVQAGEVRFPLTALEYVLAGRFAHASAFGFDSMHDVEIAMKSLTDMDALQFARIRFNELSSGERQRIVLARAMAQEPRMLLLDEPTANADLAHQISLLGFVKGLTRERKMGVLFVTHEINLAAEFADRVALIKDGRLLTCGRPEEVMTVDLLSQLFELPLLIDKHPVSGKPRISWLSGR
ncbi:MAG: ABC transporter ATP-binding protein [Acidobacteria bacterium]|nr:ABC transporter ATP-binding protein [Acidobacteriota bacterium]